MIWEFWIWVIWFLVFVCCELFFGILVVFRLVVGFLSGCVIGDIVRSFLLNVFLYIKNEEIYIFDGNLVF